MAFTNVGFDGTVNEQNWAGLWAAMLKQNWHEGSVDAGMLPTNTATNRTISMASGQSFVPGVLVTNNVAANLTFGTNTSGNPRIDLAVLNVDWTTNTVSYVAIPGTPNVNPVAPTNYTQNAGTLWQMPIARVTLPNNATTNITVEDVRPQRRRALIHKQSYSLSTIGSGSSGVTIATINVPDPGWPYRLECSAYVEFATITSGVGYGMAEITVDGATLTGGRAANLNAGPAVVRPEISAIITGAASTVRLVAIPNNMSQSLVVQSQYGGFTVRRIPA